MLKENVKTVTWQFYVINPHNHTFQSVQEQRIALLINIFINSKISPKFLHGKKRDMVWGWYALLWSWIVHVFIDDLKEKDSSHLLIYFL